jgi:small subunit ribosomal protein S8
MVTDSISDMLTRIRNAIIVKHEIVKIPFTTIAQSIAQILKEEGFIENVEIIKTKHNYIVITLRYIGISRKSVIKKLQRVSKPGLRVYVNQKQLPQVLNNLGIAIISTSYGVMTSNKAKEFRTGGEILCNIW